MNAVQADETEIINQPHFTFNDLKLRCSAVLEELLKKKRGRELWVNLSLGRDIDCFLNHLLPLSGQHQARLNNMWAKAVKWKVGLKLLTHTQTSNTHTDKRNRCKHTGKYQTLTAFRSHVRLRAPRVLTTIGWHMLLVLYGVAAILRSFIISAFNVCGKRHKDFRLRISQATVVLLLWTDWHVFPLWIWNPRPWPKRSSQASAVPIRLELGNPQTAFETSLHVCQSWVEFGSANRIALETRYLF